MLEISSMIKNLYLSNMKTMEKREKKSTNDHIHSKNAHTPFLEKIFRKRELWEVKDSNKLEMKTTIK